jgi:hypothetical protein
MEKLARQVSEAAAIPCILGSAHLPESYQLLRFGDEI